jgi:hypothetical protein
MFDPEFGVKLSKFQRLKFEDDGYTDQQDLITKGLKQGNQLGGHAYEVGKRVDKSDRAATEERSKAFAQTNERLKQVEEHCIEYDLITLAKVFHLQPGITREISQERLMSLNIDQIFDLTKEP